MKRFMMILTAAAVLMTTAAFAEDGAAIYKAKCAGCHGAAGEGKMGPAIKGKSLDVVTKGGAKGIHAKPIAGVTAEQVSAIAAFLK
ncbi:MAG: c-type cytochrome [Acidobacteriota bacterium]|nr:c-type cytochrome [Acidobacteriota bacterium]